MDIWWILSILLSAVIGCATTWLFNRKKLPRHFCKISDFVSKDYNNSNIGFLNDGGDSESKDDVYMLTLAFWNSGKTLINKSDVIKFPSITCGIYHTILYAFISDATDDGISCSTEISSDKKTVSLHFDYLDHNQGFVVKIFTTAWGLSEIRLTHSVKECKKIDKKLYNKNHDRRMMRVIPLSLIIWSAIQLTVRPFDPFVSILSSCLLFCISLTTAFGMRILNYLRYLKVPTGLKKYFKSTIT